MRHILLEILIEKTDRQIAVERDEWLPSATAPVTVVIVIIIIITVVVVTVVITQK